MAVSYKKLWKLLIDRDMKKKDLCAAAGISHASVAKLGKNENVTTDVYKGTASRTLSKGTYYLQIYDSNREYYFTLNADKTITLAKGNITSLKSNKSGQLIVSCKSVPYAIGYRIQYSTDYRFRKGVKTIYSPVRIKTLTKLSKGKRYYVRVTPYTVYTDGEHAWGATSYVKSAAVKK